MKLLSVVLELLEDVRVACEDVIELLLLHEIFEFLVVELGSLLNQLVDCFVIEMVENVVDFPS